MIFGHFSIDFLVILIWIFGNFRFCYRLWRLVSLSLLKPGYHPSEIECKKKSVFKIRMFWTVLASRSNFSQKVGTLKIRLKKDSSPNSKNESPCASAKEGNRGSDLVKDVLSQHQNSGLSHENRSKMYQNHPKSLWSHHKSTHWMIPDFPSAVDVSSTPTELRNRQFWKATLLLIIPKTVVWFY